MKKVLAWLGKALGVLLVILGSVVVLPLLLEWLMETQIGQPPVARVMPLPFGWYGHEYRQALRKLMAAVQ